MIIDVIDCLLCNAGCCNMKHVTPLYSLNIMLNKQFFFFFFFLKIIFYYVLMCSVADSNIQLYFIVLSRTHAVDSC